MIKPIMKDEAFLAIKSAPATKMDTQVAQDLKDTLQAYSDQCVGMAANMIGVSKNIIIFAIGPAQIVMYNPKITKKSRPYRVKEYQDESFKKCKQSYSGFVAQIIQHEIDHCNGIII